MGHCKSIAAFAAVARAMGQWIDFPSDCSSYKSYTVGQEFKQKPLKKALDVVSRIPKGNPKAIHEIIQWIFEDLTQDVEKQKEDEPQICCCRILWCRYCRGRTHQIYWQRCFWKLKQRHQCLEDHEIRRKS